MLNEAHEAILSISVASFPVKGNMFGCFKNFEQLIY